MAVKSDMVDSEYLPVIKDLLSDSQQLQVEIEEGKNPEDLLYQIGNKHCNRCHFKMRWQMIDKLSAYPGSLQ